GIIDKLDKCPSQPEDFNGFEDEDGCPDAPDKTKPPEPDAPLTLEQVTTLPAPIEFKFDTAIMLPGAEVYLNQVLRVLQNHPEVTKLEIQGHTSSEGGAEYNLRLSNDRATAVFTWLVDHGIDPNRLVPRGYGLTQPLMPNDTEPHRQHNRRVQFRLLEQASGTTPVNSQLRTAPPTDAPPPASTVPSQAAPAAPSPSPAPPRPVARPPS
ncbi:MAG: OmpA family protein, partial [Deltaproteobacteria bacterium]